MTTQHTPEPWSWLPNEGQFIVDNDRNIIAEIPCQGANAEDGRRIVACVNACAGIDTAQLEAEAGKLFPQPRLLTAQRDELAEALRECITSEGAACFSDIKGNPLAMQRRLYAIADLARHVLAKLP